MSNDLISRSAAEKLLRAYADEVGCRRGEYELANGILKAATFLSDSENVPTAYDVDKVVEQLEKEGNNIFESHFPEEPIEFYNNGIARGFWKAEEIVKVGG